MNTLILEDGLSKRHHYKHVSNLLKSTNGLLRVATAYVTDSELLTLNPKRDRRLLISLSQMDVISGATSINALDVLIRSGVECRALPGRPRLHAKVYIFGDSHAVITSANLTTSALNSNIEAGVELRGDSVARLTIWFDTLWQNASLLTQKRLSELQRETHLLRREYINLNKKINAIPPMAGNKRPDATSIGKLQDLFSKEKQFFVCNSNRANDERIDFLERKMLKRGFACAWEPFRNPKRLQEVKAGNAIFLFAKGFGIIAVGEAKDQYEVLASGDSKRIRKGGYKKPEWRVPVRWLKIIDKGSACKWKNARRFTFGDVSGSQYDDFREDVKKHFLSDHI